MDQVFLGSTSREVYDIRITVTCHKHDAYHECVIKNVSDFAIKCLSTLDYKNQLTLNDNIK